MTPMALNDDTQQHHTQSVGRKSSPGRANIFWPPAPGNPRGRDYRVCN